MVKLICHKTPMTTRKHGNSIFLGALRRKCKLRCFRFECTLLRYEVGYLLGRYTVEGLKAVEDAEVGANFRQANGKVALANNIDLKAYYNFNFKGKKKLNGQDVYNSWGVSVNYKF